MVGLNAFWPLMAQANLGDSMSMWSKAVIAVGVLAGSVLLGIWLSKFWRMQAHAWRFAVVLFAISASASIVALGWPPKLGVDLSGGVILVYEVDPSKRHDNQDINMSDLVTAVSRRINPGGQKEVVVRPFGQQQVEVIIPKVDADTLQEIKRIISTAGLLEFRITANHTDHERVIQRALLLTNANLPEIREGTGENARVVARWVKLDETQFRGDDRDLVLRGEIGKREVLVMMTPPHVLGDDLEHSAPGYDPSGRPAVHFSLTSRGAQKFGQLTGNNVPSLATGFKRRLGVVLDDVLKSAPEINSRIDNNGIIQGNFTQAEVESYVGVFNAGKLPAALRPKPISEQLIGPQLGADTVRTAGYAMILSSVLVPLFMIVYYRFSGFVATFAVALNLLMVTAAMITISAPFTLAGLAGLALTLGMAVDANVLIYERMREEKARGAALRMVIRNGFDRALSTVVDSNLTTMIAATVLYWVGTDQVKGFAVALWLGIVLNLFTAVFCTRVVFDIAEKLRILQQLKMMQFFAVPHIDFLGKRRMWVTISIVGISLLMVAVYVRAKAGNLMDIDFSGGSSVQAVFDPPIQEINVVRDTAGTVLDDVGVSPVRIIGEPEGKRYRIDTSMQDLDQVKADLAKAFEGKLARLDFQFDRIEQIPREGEAPAAGPALEAPAPSTPEAAPATPQAAPPSNGSQSSRTALPGPNELAMAGANRRLLAQAETTSPATTPQADSKAPSTEAATQPAATVTSPASSESGSIGAVTPALQDPFAGGSKAQVTLSEKLAHSALQAHFRAALESLKINLPSTGLSLVNLEGGETTAESGRWEVRAQLPLAQMQKLLSAVQEQVRSSPAFPSSNSFGPQVANKTTQNAVYALVLSWVMMILYVWFRFQKVSYGLAAVLALVHDVLVTLGAIALSWYVADALGFLMVEQFKINLTVIAAFLTIIGFSVNDTIVIFDRVREVKGKSPRVTVDMINLSLNQTLSRTILTTFTALMVVVIFYVAGGDEIHAFAFSLLIGMISGTYSTIYIASPLLLWLSGAEEGREPAKTRIGETQASGTP